MYVDFTNVHITYKQRETNPYFILLINKKQQQEDNNNNNNSNHRTSRISNQMYYTEKRATFIRVLTEILT